MFALPAVPLIAGLQPADPAHAAESQTDALASSALSNSAKPSLQMAMPAQRDPATTAPDIRQVECVAKVIVHEAGNQMRRGQVAVAQVIRTRMQRLGVASDACRVVHERGQFFNVDRFKPARDTVLWRNAMAIATETLKGEGEDIVPGALFFRTAARPFKGRIRVAQIDNHVFYR